MYENIYFDSKRLPATVEIFNKRVSEKKRKEKKKTSQIYLYETTVKELACILDVDNRNNNLKTTIATTLKQ